MLYSKTTDKIVTEDYPYGFRLRTTKTDWLEFDKKHGFRHCSQTIDPRNGRLNAPKKSTYSDILVIGKDEENGYTKVGCFSFYDQKDIDKITEFLSDSEHFALFTQEQIEYIYIRLLGWIKTSIYAQVQYCGSKADDLFPLYQTNVEILVDAVKNKGTENIFNKLSFDWEKINSFKVEGYNPFKVVS